MSNVQILAILGPTASGKTALGVSLAHALGGEVISCDSMQIYRRMDIGTAKPAEEEKEGVPHHMIDVCDPEENFSVGRYAEMASACAEEIMSRGARPILVGGTGQYADALLRGTDFASAPGDTGLREQLCAEYDAAGGESFRERLRAVDPERAEKLAPADKKRLVRAMEVFLLTGETITAHDERTRALPPKFTSLRAALTWRDRERLYARIDERVDLMVRAGLFREVEELLRSGVPENATAMQAIGYKEVAAALRGECTAEEAVESVKRESRRYAKRQLTWLRRDPGIRWLEREEFPTTEALTEQVLSLLRAAEAGENIL